MGRPSLDDPSLGEDGGGGRKELKYPVWIKVE